MVVAGIGMKRGASTDDILGAIDKALKNCRIERTKLNAIATIDDKATEAGLTTAAKRLRLPVIERNLESMKCVAHLAQTNSKTSMAVKGVPSVAETAALAASGENAKLLTPRVINGFATCAIASDEVAPSCEGASP